MKPSRTKIANKRTKKSSLPSAYLTSDGALPSKTIDKYWLSAFRKTGVYPAATQRSGKWLIFIPASQIDEVWRKVRVAVEEGRLGNRAKVSTAKPNPNSKDPSKHVICIYTYDSEDVKDLMSIRETLREIGIVNKIPYKTDEATLRRQYEKTGHRRVSKYYE